MSDKFKQKYDTDDLGFDRLFNKAPLFEDNPQSQNVYSDEVASQFIGSGSLGANLDLVDGFLQSSNYEAGSAGWMIDADGNAEFESGYFRGDISAATGTFGGTFDGDLDGATGDFAGDTEWANVQAGTNANALNIGHGNVKIDGANKRIIINDGTNDRILIGYLAGKF